MSDFGLGYLAKRQVNFQQLKVTFSAKLLSLVLTYGSAGLRNMPGTLTLTLYY